MSLERHTDSAPYAHLTDWTSEKLFQAAVDVDGLVNHPGWQVLTGLIDGQRQQAFDRLAAGPTRAHEQVYRDIGFIRGLDEFARAAKSVPVAAQRMHERLAQREKELSGV